MERKRSVKTPQLKKEESYKHDMRSTYGESSKGSRKSIPRHKQRVNKDFRSGIKTILGPERAKVSEDVADEIEDRVGRVHRKDWKKGADEPLGKVVKKKIESRIRNHGRSKRPKGKLL